MPPEEGERCVGKKNKFINFAKIVKKLIVIKTGILIQ